MNCRLAARGSPLLTILLATLVTPAAPAIEVSVPLSTPRLTALTVEVPVGEAAAILEASLRYDAKGKVVGEATIDGAATTVKGTLKHKGDLWLYTVQCKGVTEKVSLKVSGTVGSDVAAVTYAGPRGKAKIPALRVSLLASLGSSAGSISASVQVDSKGKISGSGRLTSGFGNDPSEDGKITGKVTKDTLTITLKSGKRTVNFKGTLQGSAFVGTLKVKAPPAKETIESFSIPIGGDFEVPDGGGHHDGDDDIATEEFIQFINLVFDDSSLRGSGGVQVTKVTTRSGKVFKHISASLGVNNNYYSVIDPIRVDIDARTPPASVGAWFSAPVFLYDINNPGHFFDKKSGTISVAVSAVDGETVSGTWEMKDNSGKVIYSGTWRDPPANRGPF